MILLCTYDEVIVLLLCIFLNYNTIMSKSHTQYPCILISNYSCNEYTHSWFLFDEDDLCGPDILLAIMPFYTWSHLYITYLVFMPVTFFFISLFWSYIQCPFLNGVTPTTLYAFLFVLFQLNSGYLIISVTFRNVSNVWLQFK